MSGVIEEHSEFQIFTTERAAELMSGDTPGAVTTWFLEQGCRDGRWSSSKVGRRRMWTRDQILDVLKACAEPATKHAHSARR